MQLSSTVSFERRLQPELMDQTGLDPDSHHQQHYWWCALASPEQEERGTRQTQQGHGQGRGTEAVVWRAINGGHLFSAEKCSFI